MRLRYAQRYKRKDKSGVRCDAGPGSDAIPVPSAGGRDKVQGPRIKGLVKTSFKKVHSNKKGFSSLPYFCKVDRDVMFPESALISGYL